jgi:DNA polymerase-3 subunit alpha
MNATEVLTLMQARSKYAKSLSVNLRSESLTMSSVAKIQDILQPYRGGSCPVHIQVEHADAVATLATGPTWFIEPEDELISTLRHVLGAENISLSFQ